MNEICDGDPFVYIVNCLIIVIIKISRAPRLESKRFTTDLYDNKDDNRVRKGTH